MSLYEDKWQSVSSEYHRLVAQTADVDFSVLELAV